MANLIRAAENGNLAEVNRILKDGANPNIVTETGETPIFNATRLGHVDVVKALIAAGADLNRMTDHEGTILMVASAHNQPEVVQALLEAGADPNIQSPGGTTLMYAISDGHINIVKLLLDGGANVNLSLEDGTTPLNLAAEAGNIDIVRLLLEHPNTRNILKPDMYTVNSVNNNRFLPEINLLIKNYYNSIKQRQEIGARLRMRPGFEPKNQESINRLGSFKSHPNVWEKYLLPFIGPKRGGRRKTKAAKRSKKRAVTRRRTHKRRA